MCGLSKIFYGPAQTRGCEPRRGAYVFLRVRPVISFYETAGFKAVSTRGGRVRVRAAVPWRSGAAAGASTVVPRSSDKSNLDETRPPSFHDRVGFECFVVFGIQRFTPSPFTPPPRLRAPRAHLDTSCAWAGKKSATRIVLSGPTCAREA